jgi:hypothetical protein
MYDDEKAWRSLLPAKIVKFINPTSPRIISLKSQNGLQENRWIKRIAFSTSR